MFFPGMDVPSVTKRRLVREVLGTLAEHYALVPMTLTAAEVTSAGGRASGSSHREAPSPHRIDRPGAAEDALLKPQESARDRLGGEYRQRPSSTYLRSVGYEVLEFDFAPDGGMIT